MWRFMVEIPNYTITGLARSKAVRFRNRPGSVVKFVVGSSLEESSQVQKFLDRSSLRPKVATSQHKDSDMSARTDNGHNMKFRKSFYCDHEESEVSLRISMYLIQCTNMKTISLLPSLSLCPVTNDRHSSCLLEGHKTEPDRSPRTPGHSQATNVCA